MLVPEKISIRLLLSFFVCAAALSGVTLQAQSTLNFPRLSFEANALTGIAIVNPADTDAVVTFTAYGADGEPVAGMTDPEPVTILAGQQFSKLTSELFGSIPDPETVGWFQATSPTSDLVGFFLFLNLPLPASLFDGADVPASSDSLVFPQVRIDSDYSTELNIINPNSTSAVLELKLIGGATLTQPLSLPAMGVARLDVQDFFGVVPTGSDQYVTVTSNVDIAGFEFVRAPTGDLVGLGARSGDERLSQLYFPQVAVFGGFETSVGIVNNSDQAVILDISFFDPSGALLDDATESLSPGNILVENLTTILPSLTGPALLQGWLKVESTLPAITGFLTYAYPETGSAATVTAAQLGLSQSLFSHIATVEGFFTGIAVLNPGQLAANIRILVMQPGGESDILGSFDGMLRPGERISKLITELVENSTDQGAGFMFLRSTLPVYSSSLFGSSAVLANIPPQLSPEGFDPDASISPVQVNPLMAVLQPSGAQTFEAQGITGEVTWQVNDLPGGDSTVGTIDENGQYTAPLQVPLPRVVTVSAKSGLQKGGASVDVLEKDQIFASTEFVVQSVAYLGSLQNLYTAELAILSSSGEGSAPQGTTPAQISNNSEIFEITAPNIRISIKDFDDEKVTKIIPFTASTDPPKEFLLLAAQTAGKVIRLDPLNGAAVDVATGLDSPTSLVINTSTGNLLVAEQNQVTIIPKQLLETGLLTARLPGAPRPQALTLPLGGDGVARDRCTGDIYATDALAGVISRFSAETQQVTTTFSGLQGPGQLLALYRNGISCPHSLQLLLVEAGANRLSLLTPALDLVVPWVSDIDSTDVAFLPGGSPFATTSAILLSELFNAEQPQQGEGGSALSFFGVPDLYSLTGEPDNEPLIHEDQTPITFSDNSLEACALSALSLHQFVTRAVAKTLTQLDCSSRQIVFLDGLEFFSELTEFVASDNLTNRDEALAGLDKLTKLDLRNNKFPSDRLTNIAGLVGLTELDMCGQLFATPFGDVPGIQDLDFVEGLVNLQILRLCDGNIDLLTSLSGLVELQELDLENNLIADLSPLIANPGFGSGDTLRIAGNNLDTADCADINTLIGRGVTVEHDLTCPSIRILESGASPNISAGPNSFRPARP
jgi:hypothetical protein